MANIKSVLKTTKSLTKKGKIKGRNKKGDKSTSCWMYSS